MIILSLSKLYYDKRLDGDALQQEFLKFHRTFIELSIPSITSCDLYPMLEIFDIDDYNDLIILNYGNFVRTTSIIITYIRFFLFLFFWSVVFIFSHFGNTFHCGSYKIDQKCEHHRKCVLLSPKFLQPSKDEQNKIRKYISELVPKNNWDKNLNNIIADYAIGNYMCFHSGMQLSINNTLKIVKFLNGEIPRIRDESGYIEIMNSDIIGIYQCRCFKLYFILVSIVTIYFILVIILN